MSISKNLFQNANKSISPAALNEKSCQRILLAEDCPVTSLTIKEMLQRYGYDVTVTHNGNEALQTLQNSQFDCALLDLEMPMVDGFEVCRRLRSGLSDTCDQSLPVIGISSHPSSLLRKLASKIGMHELLQKPLDFDILADILQSIKKQSEHMVCETTKIIDNQTPPEILDKKAALERLAGAEELYLDLLRKIRDLLPQKHRIIADAVDTDDFKTVEITAHNLASSLGTVGAQQCMSAAKMLCLNARTKNAEGIRSSYHNFLKTLENLLARLNDELN